MLAGEEKSTSVTNRTNGNTGFLLIYPREEEF